MFTANGILNLKITINCAMNSHPRSLTKNFIYSIINTVSGLLFPLFTFPYATRVLMPEGIGQVNFIIQLLPM